MAGGGARLSVVLSLNAHFTTWCNRGSGTQLADKSFVKGGNLSALPLLERILCHVGYTMFS